MQSGVGRQGLTSTKLGLKSHWTVGVTWTELLDSRDLARRAERRPKGPVSAHQKKDIWRAIAKDIRTLVVYHRRSTHCRKRWEDIRRWSKKTAEAQLGMSSQRGRGARRTMTPLMFRILVVAYPELDGRLRASQQPQGASSGGGAVASEHEGAASHMALEGDTTESDFTSGMEAKKLASARRERGKTPATKAASRGTGGSVESAVTPSKVGKGHKKPGKSGKSSMAEKTAIIPAAQEARTSPAAQEATASTSPPAQEATASTSPPAQEASTSPAAQEATASTSPPAQEATASTSPASQKATASTSPPAQEATASTSPPAQEATASTSPAAQEATASKSPAGP
ncbi:hypothetical protein NDU88_005867 [Pleurodeles waltl]|uniref:Myb-like domain-containing protein n=1 Tax=Pleurodeles waltl TaxID=8319 RepID=A0AAV7WD60_PLEWA|nr:hypothetical protein NDU88_005867 [Pleurodeles waltl]